MQRYELADGQSNKFWEAGVTGSELTVRFGRIGTAGQVKTKAFADAQGAQREYEKLVREKTGKGYALAGGVPAVAAVASRAQPTVAAQSQPAEAAPAPPVEAPPAAPVGWAREATPASAEPPPKAVEPPNASPTTLIEPHGGFAWTPALRAELPIVRGIHTPERWKPFRADAPMPPFPAEPSYDILGGHLALSAARLRRAWEYWGADAARHNAPEQLQRRVVMAWSQRLAQGLAAGKAPARWAIETCIALHGPAFALEAALPLCSMHASRVIEALMAPLRSAIAMADEAAYHEALETSERLVRDIRGRDAGAGKDAEVVRAYAFPHVGAWAEACLEGPDAPIWLLQSCAISVAKFLERDNYSVRELRTGILLQALIHGEKAAPVMQRLLNGSLWQNDELRRALQIVSRMRVPQLLPMLVPHADRKEVKAALEDLAADFPAAVLRSVIAHTMAGRDATLQGWAFRLGQSHARALPAALAAVDEAARRKFESLSPPPSAPDATPDNLPPVLRDPPWLRPKSKTTAGSKLAPTPHTQADRLPARMPKLPGFFVAAAMRRPLLHSGGALPLAAVDALGSLLAISELRQPHAGLSQVQQACTPASLSAFAWDLFEAWLASGAPPKESWAFTALGLLGGDDAARRLAPRIRNWPGEGFQSRAVTGLDILAAIGTDVALMHLNAMALKLRYKPLQERARERIAAVAEARGLGADELADRLVPDLGLDDDGRLVLDFGPRRFEAGFDEALVPFVRDAQRARLSDLPKPTKADDAERAAAAVERWKTLKKDARAIASQQMARLELAMVEQRRWSAQAFHTCFVEHPLMRHLAARLLWGVYQDGRFERGFRVAEDATLADANDAAFTLPADAVVGIAHVLEIDPGTRNVFAQLWGDYEILQPFPQLGREAFALAAGEMTSEPLRRFADRPVTSGSLVGLVNRGWRKDEAESGCVNFLLRPLPDGLEARLRIDPGLRVGDFDRSEAQSLPELVLQARGGAWNAPPQAWSRLGAIAVSELLRDLHLLAAAEE